MLNKQKGTKGTKGGYENINLIDELYNLREKYEIGDVIFDRSLRIDKDGKFFSTAEFDAFTKKQLNKFSSTRPGKLFAGVDIRLRSEAPIMAIMKAGTTSKESAYEMLNNGTILTDAKIALGKSAKLFSCSSKALNFHKKRNIFVKNNYT